MLKFRLKAGDAAGAPEPGRGGRDVASDSTTVKIKSRKKGKGRDDADAGDGNHGDGKNRLFYEMVQGSGLLAADGDGPAAEGQISHYPGRGLGPLHRWWHCLAATVALPDTHGPATPCRCSVFYEEEKQTQQSPEKVSIRIWTSRGCLALSRVSTPPRAAPDQCCSICARPAPIHAACG